jgi:hypothetical protein
MKKTVLFLLLGLITTFVAAQTTPEEYIEAFFAKVEKGNYEGAIDAMPISKLMEKDTAQIAGIIKKLEANSNRQGEYCGFEQVKVEETSPSLINYTYFIKYENAPQRIAFVFYKPRDSWQVNRINLAGTGNSRSSRANPQSRFMR